MLLELEIKSTKKWLLLAEQSSLNPNDLVVYAHGTLENMIKVLYWFIEKF